MNRHGPPSCVVCRGAECWGGGNRSCAQRDPYPSKVACILDSYGGTRVVVDYDPKDHARADEFCVIVKGLRVHEPIAWGDIPGCVGRAEHELERWVKRNAHSNDEAKRNAIFLWTMRKAEFRQRTLDLESICYT